MTIGEALSAIRKACKVTNGKVCGILERKDDNIYIDIENGAYTPIETNELSKFKIA